MRGYLGLQQAADASEPSQPPALPAQAVQAQKRPEPVKPQYIAHPSTFFFFSFYHSYFFWRGIYSPPSSPIPIFIYVVLFLGAFIASVEVFYFFNPCY